MFRSLPDSVVLRRNMVDGQIRPHCVLRAKVLEAFLAIPRELFIPKSFWEHTYTDKELKIAPGRVMFPPLVLAHILASISPSTKNIAVLGCGYGYLSALLSLSFPESEIMACESIISCYKGAQEQLAKYNRILLHHHSLEQPFDIAQQFDLIIYDGGSVHAPLRDHLSYLKPEGSILFIGGNQWPTISHINAMNKEEEITRISPLSINISPLSEVAQIQPFII